MTIDAFSMHCPHPYFDTRDGELLVGGRRISEIATDIGGTPFYAYDRSVMNRKIAELRRALPDGVHVHYALKANPMPSIVHNFRGLVDGMDVASAGELEVALESGMPPERISFAGPGKRLSELERAVAAGVTINLESATEMRRIAGIAHRTAKRPRVAIRVNPEFEVKSSGMKMSGGPKQFGVDSEQVPDLLVEMAQLPIEFWGFHIFSGSQILRHDAIVEVQRKSAQLAIELARRAPGPVRLLNLGGGFGIPYFPGEQPLDLGPVGDGLSTILPTIAAELPEAQVTVELGRFLVGESGVYVCRVLDRKVSRGQVFLVTDGGLHHHLAASGNFGQVIRKNFPVLVATRIGIGATENASVVGPLCTPLDLLADRMDLARAEIGDLIAVFQSGAYGFTASPHLFLSHPEPREVVV